jgi:Bacterial SH3 domain
MNKLIVIALFAMFVATGSAHARVMTCSGDWVDMRAIGLNVGDCDLNSISVKELEKIKDICGEPWNPYDQENEGAQCRIKALVVPFTNQRGAKVYKVLKMLRVLTEKRGATDILVVLLKEDNGETSVHYQTSPNCQKVLKAFRLSKANGIAVHLKFLSPPEAEGAVLEANCIHPNGLIKSCVVADPTGTPLNVRNRPNGPILGALSNDSKVFITDMTKVGGRKWAKVVPLGPGKTGWVFRDYLICE